MPNPGGITTAPVLWLEGDAGVLSSSGSVYQWNDQSPSENNAIQSNSSYWPTLGSLLNGKQTVNFTRQYLALTTPFNPGADWTVCAVMRQTNTSTILACISSSAVNPTTNPYGVPYGPFAYTTLGTFLGSESFSTGYPALWSSDVSTAWGFVTGVNASNALSLYRAGVAVSGGVPYNPATTVDTTFDWIGTRNGGGTELSLVGGDLAEVIVFPTALLPADRQAVETYLYTKWFVARSKLIPPMLYQGAI